MMKKRRGRNNYINNKDLYQSLVDFKNKRTENPDCKVPNYIGQAIMLICQRLSTKSNFFSYTFRDEMIDDAIENCVMAIKSFNPEKTDNPFAYFTMVAYNAFRRRINEEKAQQYVKHKNFQNFIMSSGNVYNDNGEIISQNEHSIAVIDDFEKKELDRKAKIKKTNQKQTQINALDEILAE